MVFSLDTIFNNCFRRYGVVESRFCFEGGSRCGRGEGLYVLVSDQGEDIARTFQMAAEGKLSSKRRSSTRNSIGKLIYLWLYIDYFFINQGLRCKTLLLFFYIYLGVIKVIIRAESIFIIIIGGTSARFVHYYEHLSKVSILPSVRLHVF